MIRAYIGLLGEGKTLAMVMDACQYLKKKKRVISNLPIKIKHWGKEYKSDFYSGKEFEKQILNAENCLVCIDEASIVFPSYFWNKIPGEYIYKWAQSRKFGVDIFFTTQRFGHSIRRLRDLTNEVVRCQKSNQLFSFITYNPEYFENKIIPSIEIEKRFIMRRKLVFPWTARRYFKAYDTLFKVEHSVLADINVEKEKSNDW